MPRRPTWEDADLLLRMEEFASRPETRQAIDWFHRNRVGVAPQPEVEYARDTPEFDYLHRFVGLYEMVGVLVRSGLLSEDLALEFWNVWDPWVCFQRTIARERKATGPEWAENFEWLALRERARRDAKARKAAGRRGSRSP